MSQTVDTKVVELRFESDDFTKKIEETYMRLELLNRKLDEFVTDKLSNVGKAADNVNVDSLGESVDETGRKFNALEKIATGALMTIGNYITRTGARLINNLISPITSGGLQRALNIEQASFQFEGLGVDMSKADKQAGYYTKVMNAVLGTAYSYDVAARAASQLATSNVGVTESTKKLADGSEVTTKVMNEDMTKALLAIAGASAMSGSQFEQIADIFLNAAGKGAAMGDEFRRLSLNSINGYEIMAKYYGKTSDEVRKMASKGEVAFSDFAKAMSDAFGAHAKESTKTFNGALEDTKAALARIGADFYGPALTGAKDMLNALTPLVDIIHEKISNALTSTTNLLGKASAKVTQLFDLLSFTLKFMERTPDDIGLGKSLINWLDENLTHEANLLDAFGNNTETVRVAIDDLGKGLKKFGNGYKIDGIKMLADYLNMSMDDVEKGLDNGTIGLKTFEEALLDLYSQSSEFQKAMSLDKLKDWISTWTEVSWSSESGEKLYNTAKKLANIFNGLKDIVNAFGKVFKAVGSIIGTVAIALEPLWTLLGKAAVAFAEFTYEVITYVSESKGFQLIVDGINNLLTGVSKLLHITELAGSAAGIIIRIFDELAQAVKAVYDGVVKIINTVIELLDRTIEKLADIFGNITTVIALIRKLSLFALFGALAEAISSIFKPVEYATSIVDMFKNIGKSIENVFGSIEKLSGTVKGVFSNLASGLKELTSSIRADTVIKYAVALTMLAGSLYLLSQIDADKAAQSVALFGSTVAGLVASFAVITGILGKADSAAKKAEKGNFIERILGKFIGKGTDKYKSVGNFMLKMAAAILILAAALKVIGSLPADKIIYATGAIELLLLTLAGIAKVLGGTNKVTAGLFKGFESTTNSMTKGLAGLMAMAGAVYILAKAMENLSDLDPDKLATSFAFVSAILWELTGVVYVMSRFKAKGFLKASVSLLIFAKAVEMFMKNLEILANFDNQEDLNWALLRLAGIVAMLTVASIALSRFGGMGVLDAAAIYIFVQAITALIGGLQLLTTIDSTALSNAFGYLLVLMGALTFAVLGLGELGSVGLIASVAIYVFVQAIGVLVDALIKISEANLENVGTALIVVAGAITILGVACAVFKKIPLTGILKFGLALGVVVLAAAGFGLAAFAIGLGMQAIAMGVKALAEVEPYLANFAEVFAVVITLLGGSVAILQPLIPAFLLLGVAFGLFALSMLGIGAGIQMIATAIQTLSDLKDELPSIVKSMTDFFKAIKNLKDESESIEDVAKIISESLTSLGNAASEAAKKFTGFKEAGQNVIKEFANGMTENSDTAATAMNTVLSSAKSKADIYPNKFYNIGKNIVMGLINGINSQKNALERAVTLLEDAAERTVKAKAKVHSPSRVWARIGAFLGLGLAKGISNSATTVVKASADLAEASTDAISSAIGIVSDKLGDDNLNPTITPVVDLSRAEASANQLGTMFGTTPIMASPTMDFNSLSTSNLVKGINVKASGTVEMERQESLISQLNAMVSDLGEIIQSQDSDHTFNFTIPFDINGRELARAQATYTQEELDRMQMRENRKLGVL